MMKWHLLIVILNKYGVRLLCAFLLAVIFFILPQGTREQEVSPKASLGYITEGGQWIVFPQLQKPLRWKILTSEWPLCMASTFTDQNQQHQLNAFLSTWPGWLSLAVPGSSLDEIIERVEKVSKTNQNILDQVSFHAVYPASNTTTGSPTVELLLEVAALNNPCEWVTIVKDVGLRPPPDDGPQSALEKVLMRLGKDSTPNCSKATQYEILHIDKPPATTDELAIYEEFGILRKQPSKIYITRQGKSMQSALKGKCEGPAEKELFFSRIVHNPPINLTKCYS